MPARPRGADPLPADPYLAVRIRLEEGGLFLPETAERLDVMIQGADGNLLVLKPKDYKRVFEPFFTDALGDVMRGNLEEFVAELQAARNEYRRRWGSAKRLSPERQISSEAQQAIAEIDRLLDQKISVNENTPEAKRLVELLERDGYDLYFKEDRIFISRKDSGDSVTINEFMRRDFPRPSQL